MTAKTGTRTTSAIIFAKGLVVLAIGGTELVRTVASHHSMIHPRAPLEREWPALSLLACGVWDLLSYRALREGENRAWLGGMMSATVVLLYAMLGANEGALYHPGALGVAGALALVFLAVFQHHYRPLQSRAYSSEEPRRGRTKS